MTVVMFLRKALQWLNVEPHTIDLKSTTCVGAEEGPCGLGLDL